MESKVKGKFGGLRRAREKGRTPLREQFSWGCKLAIERDKWFRLCARVCLESYRDGDLSYPKANSVCVSVYREPSYRENRSLIESSLNHEFVQFPFEEWECRHASWITILEWYLAQWTFYMYKLYYLIFACQIGNISFDLRSTSKNARRTPRTVEIEICDYTMMPRLMPRKSAMRTAQVLPFTACRWIPE